MTTQEAGDGHDLENEIWLQKTALLYRNGGLAFLVTIVNGSILAFLNAGAHTPYRAALAWWLILTSFAVGRLVLAHRYRASHPDVDTASSRRHHYIGASAALGAIWGSSAFVFILGAPADVRMFTGLVIAGMVAGAVPVLAAVPFAFHSFAFSALFPVLAVSVAQASSRMDWAFAAMTVVFFFGVTASAKYMHQSLEASIRLGIGQARHARSIQVSEERYRQILQHSPAGILHYNTRLVITYCNERLAQILQVPRDRLIGFDMKQLKDQRVLPALLAPLAGNSGFYEGEYVSTQGAARVWITMGCEPIPVDDPSGRGAIALVQDVTDRRRSEEEIRNLAFFDPLTNLPNRRLLLDRLDHATKASSRRGQFGALILLDLDHFKRINDTQGHDTGDRMLVDVARRIVSCLREEDTVSRLGGDEYVVLIENLGQAQDAAAQAAENIAEKIRAALQLPYLLGGSEAEYFPSASIGVTLFHDGTESIASLLKQADVALYQAKDAGRNTVRFFNHAMQETIDRRATLEAALHRGLERQEFRLFYQLQVDGRGQAKGAEALIRWVTPNQSVVSPSQFIPLAEESGLILPIGQWVLDTACAQLKQWERDERTRHLRLSINVSAKQFHQADFVDKVRQSLLVSGANPHLLVLELTETVVLDQTELVVGRMEQLRALGLGFSLDDFGQGFSSLSHLKRLPLRQVKIDRAFVRGLPGDSSDAAIVRAIIAICKSLGLEAVAEGVETQDQKDFLARQGCNGYQGYLFGKPVPIEEFIQSAQDPLHRRRHLA